MMSSCIAKIAKLYILQINRSSIIALLFSVVLSLHFFCSTIDEFYDNKDEETTATKRIL